MSNSCAASEQSRGHTDGSSQGGSLGLVVRRAPATHEVAVCPLLVQVRAPGICWAQSLQVPAPLTNLPACHGSEEGLGRPRP